MSSARSLFKFLRNRIFLIYMLIVLAALAFDLLGDRSFGALMLSALPIAVLALGCLLVGPWLAPEQRRVAFQNWLIGMALVLALTLVFSSLGDEQAKTGGLVFTYAALILAFPSSLVLPFVMTWTGPLLPNTVWTMGILVSLVCVVAGSAEWWLLDWLSEKITQRKTRGSA